MKIEITKEEKEALLTAIDFFLSHGCVIYNCEKEIKSVENKLNKVVQPERLSEEDTKCPKCDSETSFDAFLQKRTCLNGKCNHVLR